MSHKSADEQTFTSYVPVVFTDPAAFKDHPDKLNETSCLASQIAPKYPHPYGSKVNFLLEPLDPLSELSEVQEHNCYRTCS